MIVYNQRGYSLLLHAGGSVLLATLPHAIVASGMNVGIWKGLEVLEFDYIEAFPNPAVYSPFSLGLAFLLVFRSSQAYQRYVEAVSHCFEIRSQLSNAMMQLHAYTTVREDTRDFHRRHRRLTYAFQRAAMQELRGEHDLAKLVNLASLLPEEAELLEPSTNRPLALMHWMVVSVSERWETGGFRCAPPVIARELQRLHERVQSGSQGRSDTVSVPLRAANDGVPPNRPNHYPRVIRLLCAGSADIRDFGRRGDLDVFCDASGRSGT